MPRVVPSLLLTTSFALIATASHAATEYEVSKVVITGSKSVPPDQLYAAITEHAGSRVTVNDILADRDAIVKVLEGAHVGGRVVVSTRTADGKTEVIFAVDDQGVQKPTVIAVAPKLNAEIFTGNVSIPSATLAADTGLSPGDDLTNDKLLAAEQAIVAAYKAAKLPVNVNVSGHNQQRADGTYDVTWTVVETKAAVKKAPPKPPAGVAGGDADP